MTTASFERCAKVRRDRDPPLPIRVRLMRAGQDEVPEARGGRVGPGSPGDVGVERGPLWGRKDGKTLTYPTRHDRSFFEAASELRWDREPTLLVQRVGKLT